MLIVLGKKKLKVSENMKAFVGEPFVMTNQVS